MNLKLLRLFVATGVILICSHSVRSQNFSFNCTRDTVVAGCPTNLCFTLKALFPDVKGLSTSYTINPGSNIPGCFPVYLRPDDPAGTPSGLSIDDRYSSVISIGFNFPFYGTVYNQLVVSTNGYVSFDISKANQSSHWQDRGDLPNTQYDPALIMGPYHDLDPSVSASPNKKIQYQVWGVAPQRRWVLSFYKVPLFQCNSLFENTHQIILYESTGIIEVKIFDKQICSSWNNGKAMVGIQDFSRTQGMTAPNRKMSDPPWGSIGMNETWRFVPDAGSSLFKRVELFDLGGNLVATGTAAPYSSGVLEASFPNVCPPAGTLTTYIVKSTFQSWENPNVEIYGTDTIRVNRLQALTGTASQTPAGCGSSNGTITVTGVSGGTAPYEYSLDGVNWQASNVFTGLPAGNYLVRVRDASGACNITIPVSVLTSGTIPASTSTTPTACIGVNNGSITITSAGGTGPYTFSLDGAPAVAGTLPYTFNNVSAGAHTIRVNDQGTGCNTGTLSVTVAVGPGVSGSATSTPTACIGVNNGSITVTANSGTAPFTWSLDGAPAVPGASPFTFNNVSSGAHSVTIRDSYNCSILVPVTVSNGPGVSGSATSTPTSCPTAANGTITVTATAGTAPFEWSLDGAAYVAGGNPYTFTGVSSGAHTVNIRDVNGCTILVPVNVTAGSALTATTTTTQTECAVATNGSITVDNANGTPPYTFSLDGAPGVPGTIPFTFNNVASGNHTLVVVDATGCSSAPITVTVAAGPGITGNATTTATSCPTANNGSITATATTGTAPFTWSLDGAPAVPGTSPYTFNNVASGSHTVTITDSYGCAVTLTGVTVNAGPALTANTSATSTSCNGASNGSITVTPVGGTAPFTFAIDGGAAVPGTPPFTFNNLAAGSHTILVTDGAGCATGSIIEIVPVGPTITATYTVTDVLCNGGNTGSITVSAPTPGIPPFEYSLDGVNWQPGNIFNGLTAGNYTVYFRENAGCQSSMPVTVNEPAALTATNATIPVVCNGQNNGTITITPSGGVAPYQYSIDNGLNWQGGNVFNVPAGNYTVIIRDQNNCTTTQTMTVTEPAALTASSVETQASCDGGNDGTITVTASGGNSSYQYSVDGVNFQTSNIFNVAPGTYTVTVKDNLGCSFSFPATVGLGNNLTFTPQTDPTICEGTSTQLQFTSNATVYSWTPSAGLSDPNISNPVANPTVTTQYIVTATLQRCTVNDTVIVNVNTAPVPDAGINGQICFGQTYQLQGSGGTQFLWTPNTYLDNPNVPNPISSATRTITYTLSIVSDANGCASLVTDDVTVDVTPPIRVTTLPFDTIAYAGEQIQLLAVSAVPAANIFTWTPSFGLSDANIANPVYTAGNVGDVNQYKVTVSSPAGCKGEEYVKVRVYKGPELYTPTAFTPNGDGRNDNFYPFPVGIRSINYFRVYNRWGNLIFSSNVLYKAWDGKQDGVEQPSGVYVWMAEGVDKNGNKLTKKGTVTLIR